MGMRESIEVRVYLRSEESHARTITQSVPGGNGADGNRATWTSARMANERERVSQSKPASTHFVKSLIRTASHESVPGGNRASRETARWTKPRRGERTGVSESIEVHVIAIPKESNAHYVTQKRSRRESNPHLRFRKPLFCPLNYGN